MSSQASQSRPLRIALMGTRGIPARYGGFETFAEQISKRLVQRNHRVTVYGRCRIAEGWGARESISGVERRVTPTIFHKYLETPLHALTSFIDAIFHSYDVILVCNAANSPFAPLLKIRGTPLLINVDGIERNRAKWNSFGKLWYLLGERVSVWLADRLISDADVIADYYRETYGCDSTVIPYGVHPTFRPAGKTLEQFGLAPREYILYVSRLEPENNALGVIEAYKKSNAEIPLVIVGDAPYADEYKAQLRAAANERVIFTGFQFGEAYEEFQSNCRLYIQATEVGGTHPALIESMSYGNCVIANGTPENREVVADAGVVFEKNNFDQLAEHISCLWNNPEKLSAFGEKAKERVLAAYSWDAVVATYEGLFLKLTGAKGVAPKQVSAQPTETD
jgi:glycosyltransferase involved in cell wall biosynthesis